jgi:hypothetical protein
MSVATEPPEVGIAAPHTHDTDDCCPTCIQIRKQETLRGCVGRLRRERLVSEDEEALLWSAVEETWDDAIHVAAPWEPHSSLCGGWGRNLVALDAERPDGMSGCWTCLMAAEWISSHALAAAESRESGA